MKKNLLKGVLMTVLLLKLSTSFSQADGDYRTRFNVGGGSVTGGSATWEKYSAATGLWTNASSTSDNPTNAGVTTTTTIRDGVSQTMNGTLTFGGKLIVGEGNAARATAAIDAGGTVTAITITTPGKLICIPGVTVVGAATTTAVGAVSSCKVSGYEVTNPGSAYTTASVRVGNVWAAGTAYALNAQVNSGGNLYTCATAGTSDAAGTGPSGTGTGIADGTVVWNYAGVAATATATVTAGAVSALTITNEGSGYISMPGLTITGDGTGATATSRVGVLAVTISNAGAGYTAAPTIYLGSYLQIGNTTTARVVTMNSDLEFKQGAALFTGDVGETITLGGNLIVASDVAAFTRRLSSNAATTFNFTKSGTATISGTGSMLFRNITLGVTATPATTTLAVNVPVSIAGTVGLNVSSVIDASNATISYVTYAAAPIPQTIAVSTYLNSLVRNLTINNTSGVTMNQDLSVTNQLTMSAGILTIPTTGTLQLSGTNLLAGTFGASTYINTVSDAATGAIGKVQVNNVSASTTIPLGNNTNYLPVTVVPASISTFATSVFTPATDNGVPSGTVSTSNNIVNAVYVVNRIAGTGNSTLTLGFPATLKGSGFAGVQNNQVGISRFNGTAWEAVIGTGDNTQNTATATYSSFSPFRVEVNLSPMPVKFGDITATKVNGKVAVNWKVYNELGVAKYAVERSVEGLHYTAVGTVNASGSLSYNFTDAVPSKGKNFYRLRSFDKDNAQYLSKAVVVDFSSLTSTLSISPNPIVSGFFTVRFSNMKPGKVTVQVFNNSGQVVFNQPIDYNGTNDSQLINLPSTLSKGVYQLVITDGLNTQKAPVVVQ
jgi:hypothetical protein